MGELHDDGLRKERRIRSLGEIFVERRNCMVIRGSSCSL